ncbi:MAG: fibronectin type III domain-containing protein [Spirochaetales bacterium]|nr:fibronectin type III domain-containing protein [Spirochaetales bacterium]
MKKLIIALVAVATILTSCDGGVCSLTPTVTISDGEVSKEKIYLGWTISSFDDIGSIVVEYSEGRDSTNWGNATTLAASARAALIEGLSAETSYNVRVRVLNPAGTTKLSVTQNYSTINVDFDPSKIRVIDMNQTITIVSEYLDDVFWFRYYHSLSTDYYWTSSSVEGNGSGTVSFYKADGTKLTPEIGTGLGTVMITGMRDYNTYIKYDVNTPGTIGIAITQD